MFYAILGVILKADSSLLGKDLTNQRIVFGT